MLHMLFENWHKTKATPRKACDGGFGSYRRNRNLTSPALLSQSLCTGAIYGVFYKTWRAIGADRCACRTGDVKPQTREQRWMLLWSMSLKFHFTL